MIRIQTILLSLTLSPTLIFSLSFSHSHSLNLSLSLSIRTCYCDSPMAGLADQEGDEGPGAQRQQRHDRVRHGSLRSP